MRAPFEPLLPNVVRVPFGDSDALAAALQQGDGRAAVILEPIQSEAGVLIPRTATLRGCERNAKALMRS